MFTDPRSNQDLAAEIRQTMVKSEWEVKTLIEKFKKLYDYQGGYRSIKIPSMKKQVAFYEVYKECTFKPKLSKVSMAIQKERVITPVEPSPGKIISQKEYETEGNPKRRL